MSKKIKIRIAAGVNTRGEWAAAGHSFAPGDQETRDKEGMRIIRDDMEDIHANYYWIEAELDVPTGVVTVQGTVKPKEEE